jgi:ring-1,2-phenylacetyl-CoA epoxidase subunit PaaC
MEEDVALGNIALDLLGQARGLFAHLGDEDQLAYFRDPADWRNPIICELPRGDFGFTMLRQLFVDSWLSLVWTRLAANDDAVVRGVAAKALKENAYHRRHSSAWVIRLGDGTEESHRRMLAAMDELWPHTAEITVDGWHDVVAPVLTDATLPVPPPALPPPALPPPARFDDDTPSADGVSSSNRGVSGASGASGASASGASGPNGAQGGHTSHLVELLADMQSLARAYPGATW